VEHSINVGLAAAHEVFRRVRRGELVYAMKLLDELRWAIVEADDCLNERPWYGFSHFETRTDPRFAAVIYGSYCPLEKDAICKCLIQLAELYREQILLLHQRFKLARSLQNDVDSIEIITGCDGREPA
jgi:hypothetical protein